jgi:hypothetical protein
MKPKLILCLALAIALVCFYLGYQAGGHQKMIKEHSQGRIRLYVGMWQIAQKGDMKQMQSVISFLLWSETYYYENQFGTVTGTNDFERHFLKAREITKGAEKNFVPFGSVATNFGSNVTVTIDPVK